MPEEGKHRNGLPRPTVSVVVTLLHVIVAVAILTMGFRTERAIRRPEAIEVSLVQEPSPPVPIPPVPIPPQPDPPPQPPEPKPEPNPPPPEPEPRPEPEPEPKPEPKPVVKQPEPKPEPKPIPIPVVTKPKPKPKPEKKWVARSPEEIARSANVRTVRQPAPRPVAPVDPNQIARRITSRVPTVTISAPAPAANVPPAETARTKEYYDAVGALLYQRWQQPSRAEAGNSTPTVTVEFHVLADGTVTRARITRTSGAVAMDGSVETLLKHVGRLPAFSGYRITAASLTFSVDFKLD